VSLGKWVGLLAFVVSVYILWQIRQVLLLVFMAIVLATALNRIVQQLQKLKIKRGIAVALSIGILFAVAAIFVSLVVPPFVNESEQLIELVPQGIERSQAWLDWIEARLPGESFQDTQIFNNLIQQLQPLAGRLFGNFFALFSNSLAIVLNLLLVLVLMIMLLVNPLAYRQGFIRLFPAFYRRRIDQILALCEVALDSWIAGLLFNMLVIAVCSGIGLWLLQVKLVLANALIAGLLEAIPNIGPALSLIPPMAIALLDAPWKAGAVLILYIVIQQLEQYLLVPTVMAKQVSLLPAVTLISQVIFAVFFGFLGLLLALPLVIVGQIWLREVLIKDVLDHWGNHAAKDRSQENSPVVEIVQLSKPTGERISEDEEPRL
jgi:predicted PurR-regulated permease PerM